MWRWKALEINTSLTVDRALQRMENILRPVHIVRWQPKQEWFFEGTVSQNEFRIMCLRETEDVRDNHSALNINPLGIPLFSHYMRIKACMRGSIAPTEAGSLITGQFEPPHTVLHSLVFVLLLLVNIVGLGGSWEAGLRLISVLILGLIGLDWVAELQYRAALKDFLLGAFDNVRIKN